MKRFPGTGTCVKRFALICGLGTIFQFGGCDLGNITTTTTTSLNARDVIIQLIRGAVITPIDAFITGAVNDAFSNNK